MTSHKHDLRSHSCIALGSKSGVWRITSTREPRSTGKSIVPICDQSSMTSPNSGVVLSTEIEGKTTAFFVALDKASLAAVSYSALKSWRNKVSSAARNKDHALKDVCYNGLKHFQLVSMLVS